MMIRNPVLPGFHPDPSILRVGADYYIATSTFEWHPGVRVHHSRDLVTWRPLGGILDSARLLDLTGCPDSGGVWAPSLSYVDGLFHLVFSNVSAYLGGFADCPNYLVTASTIDGLWSEPLLLHARGFDASLFHDGEESWLINLVHDWRPGLGGSAGLEATRYDRQARRLTGDPVWIDLPPGEGWIEGPNLYRIGDWYYLVTADGGTGYDHQVVVSRSRKLTGPYERDPDGPLLTSRYDPQWPLQKAGHGSLVQTPDGDWYMAYLVARPVGVRGRCILGRETALAALGWNADGWPTVPDRRPAVGDGVAQPVAEVDDFTEARLGPQWSTLRRPAGGGWLSLTERASHLRVHGGRSPQSLVEPSLVARRITAQRCGFEAAVDFRPLAFQHLAGVTAYYNTRNWHYLYVTADDGQIVVRLATSDHGDITVHPDSVRVPPDTPLRLGFDLDGGSLTFRCDPGSGWQRIGPVLDAAILSDEYAIEYAGSQLRSMGFTGAFAGLWVWDLTGHGNFADFDEARYTEQP